MCYILSEKYHSQQNLQGVGQIVHCAAICGDIRGRRGACCNTCMGLLCTDHLWKDAGDTDAVDHLDAELQKGLCQANS